jgi:uncharacterized phage protein gp47/JayE
MSFTIPTLDDTHEMTLALFAALLSDPNTSQGAFLWLWGKTFAGTVTDNHAHIRSVYNDLLPDTASIDTTPQNPTSALARWGGLTGKTQKGATPSSGTSCLAVYGSNGTVIPDGSLLTFSGLTFQTVGAKTIGSTGLVMCSVLGVSTGSATNLSAGTQLTFANTPSGANDVAVLEIALANGADQEAPGAYRLRVLSQLAQPAPPAYGAGRQVDYEQTALAQTGIAAAFAYPNRQGLGSVDLAALALGSGNERLLVSGQISALQSTMAALIPVGVAFRVLTVYSGAQDVEYTIVTDGTSTSAFDWDDTAAPTVSAWNATTRTLTLSTLPSDLSPGDRVVIATTSANGGTGEQSVVEAIGTGTNIVIQDAPSFTPQNGDTAYAGGPLVDPGRAALQAIFDALGTANPDSVRYGAWEGNLDPGSIDASIRDVTGVLRGTVVVPSSLVEATDPAYPSDGTIELLIAGRLLVHCQH